MLRKGKKEFIKNKLINSIKIKKIFKITILKSIIQNKTISNKIRAIFLIKLKLSTLPKTTLNDTCLSSGVYKTSNKYTNYSRYEFHRLCRNNRLTSWITYSW